MLALLLFFFGCAVSKKIILTPKKDAAVNMLLMNAFNDDHGVTHLATINDQAFYQVDDSSFYVHANTYKAMYEVEEEQTFTVTKLEDANFILIDDFDSRAAPWHLDRIVKESLPLDGNFPYNSSGSCHTNKDLDIHTYVIDTGIDVTHPEFEGRATWLENFIDDTDTDCQSHGTHCAGLVGSKSYGACKDARLFAIKVLGCDGSGSTSSVIRGIEYAYNRHVKQVKDSVKKVKSIVSMSLGGGFSGALNAAVKATLKDPNFYFAAAAGNENNDACRTSPASVREIFTVMASDRYDKRAYFSNYGNCADIYSPGVNVVSTVPGGRTAMYSGTSMSTPVLVGVLNHYVDTYPQLNMADIKKKVLQSASKNKIIGHVGKTGNNALIYISR
uniref:Peptidase S8/S53 domain-containing protein n=1 Tax=viral metagenome TaxID=1070528 RepID=A0A6C0E126_9ZZZZ